MKEFAKGSGNEHTHPFIYGDVIMFPGAERFTYSIMKARYGDSDYGTYHSQQALRFSKGYGYERSQMLQDLGNDVHPVLHMSHTETEITQPFIAVQNSPNAGHRQFTQSEIVATRLGSLLHDMGECEHPLVEQEVGKIVGDVWYEVKQSSDHDDEVPIRLYLYDKLFSDVPRPLLERAEDVINGREEFLAEAFDTIERIGYFQTAMRAGEKALELLETTRNKDDNFRLLQLSRLARRVSNNHLAVLEERSAAYPYAGVVLNSCDWLHDRIHTELAHIPA